MLFPLGLMIVGVLIILLIFDVFSRTLDILKVEKRFALIVLIAVMVGYFAPNITFIASAEMNIGGFIIPLFFGLVLLGTVSSGFRWLKALSGIAAGTLIILAFGRLSYSIMRHAQIPISAVLIAGILLGAIAFLITRSFKLSLIVCLLSSCISDILIYATNIVGEYYVLNALGESASLSVMVLGVCVSALSNVLLKTYEYRKQHKTRYAKNMIRNYNAEFADIEPPRIDVSEDIEKNTINSKKTENNTDNLEKEPI